MTLICDKKKHPRGTVTLAEQHRVQVTGVPRCHHKYPGCRVLEIMFKDQLGASVQTQMFL